MPPVAQAPIFFLDYDGTLAPIVDDPEAAIPHPQVPDLIRRLDALAPLWIVTGRDIQTLSTFFDEPYAAIGLHGSQEGTVGGEVRHRLSEDARRVLRRLRQSVPPLDGLRIEEKDPTFAVHYRDVDDQELAHERLSEWLDDLPPVVEAIWGKKVVELRPEGHTKGTAVRQITEQHPARRPVYIGDDTTDEDAFAALQDLERDTITIKVGEEETRAEYRLADPEAVVNYLRQYV